MSQFTTDIQPKLEQARVEFIRQARELATELGRDGRVLTVNDLRERLEIPAGVDPRVMGVVFKTAEWRALGYGPSDRRISHGRPVMLFRRVPAAKQKRAA